MAELHSTAHIRDGTTAPKQTGQLVQGCEGPAVKVSDKKQGGEHRMCHVTTCGREKIKAKQNLYVVV